MSTTTPGTPGPDRLPWWLKWLAAVLLAVAVAGGGYLIWRYWADLFGPGTWGSGGNMVAWVICGVISFSWLSAKEKARHLAKLAQSREHHDELVALSVAQHEELKAHVTEAVAGETGIPPFPTPRP